MLARSDIVILGGRPQPSRFGQFGRPAEIGKQLADPDTGSGTARQARSLECPGGDGGVAVGSRSSQVCRDKWMES